MGTFDFRRLAVLVVLAALAALTLAACGSDSSSSSSSAPAESESSATESESSESSATESSGSGESSFAALAAEVKEHETPATELKITELGLKPFKPKPGAKIFNVSCDVSIVGCNTVSNDVKAATEKLGYSYTRCDAGSSPEGANKCFTNAINAGADAIITNAVGANIAAEGFEAADAAGIPVIGSYTGEAENAAGTDVQVAYEQCAEEARLQAKAITAETEGEANVLYVSEKSIKCDAARQAAFEEEFPKVCPGCNVEYLEFSLATIQSALPQQMQAAINQNPDLNWIVGVFDGVAAIANTQVQQAGKEGQISVAGSDGDPANIEVMEKGGPQKIDMSAGFGEGTWSAADAAARIYSGQKVPAGIPTNFLLITPNNLDVLSADKTWEGPEGFEEKFEENWGK